MLGHNGKKAAAFLREVTVAGINSDDVERMGFQLTLRRRGISDQAVLRAMDEVPREHFVTSEFIDSAYADHALPIACGQTISQPYVVAYMTEQLEVEPQHRVLEVGTGSGYQAAILSRLAREVVSVERYRTLADPRATASRHLDVPMSPLSPGTDLPALRTGRHLTGSSLPLPPKRFPTRSSINSVRMARWCCRSARAMAPSTSSS